MASTHDSTEPYQSAPGSAQLQRDSALAFALTLHRHHDGADSATDVLTTAGAFLGFLRGES